MIYRHLKLGVSYLPGLAFQTQSKEAAQQLDTTDGLFEPKIQMDQAINQLLYHFNLLICFRLIVLAISNGFAQVSTNLSLEEKFDTNAQDQGNNFFRNFTQCSPSQISRTTYCVFIGHEHTNYKQYQVTLKTWLIMLGVVNVLSCYRLQQGFLCTISYTKKELCLNVDIS